MTHFSQVARGAVREEVMRQAWHFFATQGFEATTVDQIAEASGMSRRTFFRYFTGKDELLLARVVEAGQHIAGALRARPRQETAWQALRAAFEVSVQAQGVNPGTARVVGRMLRDEPAARATMQERRRLWLSLLIPIVSEHLRGSEPIDAKEANLRAAALAAAALSCLDVAQDAWIEDSTADLGTLLDAAMNAVTPL